MKRNLKILSFLMALLLLLSTLGGCTGYVDPLGYLKDATVKTFKEALAGEVLALLLDVADQGMIAVEFGGTDLVQNLPDMAELKLWLDAEERKLAASGKMSLAGEQYDLSAYLTENEMAVVSASFLGSNTLGVDFLTLQDDLKTSIFSNNSGTVFANPTVSAASADRVEEIKKSFFKMITYQERTLDFVDGIVDVFLDELTEYAENSRYKEDGYTHIAVSINNDALARTLRATRAALVERRFFRDYLTDVSELLDSMISAATGVASTEYTAKAKYFLANEADIDALCLRIDNAEPFTLQLKAAVKSFGMELTDVSVSFTQSNVTRLSAALHMEQDEICVDLTLDGVARKLTYEVKEEGFRTYRAALSYQLSAADTSAEIKGELLANRRDETYTLTLEKGNETRVFGGKYCFENDEMMLSVDTASVNGESKRISLKISAAADEAVPAMPAYVNVVKMDVTRFTPIHERATGTYERLTADWRANGLTFYGAIGDLLTAIALPEEIPTKP